MFIFTLVVIVPSSLPPYLPIHFNLSFLGTLVLQPKQNCILYTTTFFKVAFPIKNSISQLFHKISGNL